MGGFLVEYGNMKDTIITLIFVWIFVVLVFCFAFYMDRKNKRYKKIKEYDVELQKEEREIFEEKKNKEEFADKNKLKIFLNFIIITWIIAPIFAFIIYNHDYKNFNNLIEFIFISFIVSFFITLVFIGMLIDKKGREKMLKEQAEQIAFNRYQERNKDFIPYLLAILMSLVILLALLFS